MRPNAGMANREGDVDLRFAQVSVPSYILAWPEILQRLHREEYTSIRTSQLQHQEGWPAATSRKTSQLGTTRRASLSRYIKNGQTGLILQGVICLRRPKGVGLSVTIQKGVTSRHLTSGRGPTVLPAYISSPTGLVTATHPGNCCYASRCPLPQPTGQCCHLPGFHTAQPHCALTTKPSRSAELTDRD